MRKFLIIILLFVFFVNFISASNCKINKDNLRVEVGVYDKISENERFIFEKSKFQPNDKNKIVQEGDVLLIESFNISIDSSCGDYNNLFRDSVEISLILPDENRTSESIIIPIKFIKNPDSFDYSLKINEFVSIPDFEFLLLYNDSNGEISSIYYAPFTLDKMGEWEIKVGYNGIWYWKNIFNEGGSFRFINVLDKIDVAQLETLEQLKEDSKESSEDSKKSSRNSLWVVIIIGFASIAVGIASICIMKKTSKKQIEKMEEHFKKEIKIEEEREEEKQINLLKSLEIQLTHLSKGTLEGNLPWAKSLVEGGLYPAHPIWKIKTFDYLTNLSFPKKESEIDELKESLIKIDEKLALINNYLYEKGLDISKQGYKEAVTKLIDETVGKVEKLKKFIEENFDIKPKK